MDWQDVLTLVALALSIGLRFEGRDVYSLARSLAFAVVDEHKRHEAEEDEVKTSMLFAVWQAGGEAIGNPELECSTSGRAERFRSSEWPSHDPATWFPVTVRP